MKQWYNDVGDSMEKLIIGSHVSFSKNKQLYGSVLEALNYGSSTFMFYTGAPQNTVRVPINDQMTQEAMDLMKVNNMDINDVVIHAPYIINLANPVNHDFSVNFLKQEISRAEQLGISKIVLHPGSHVGLGMEEGIKSVSDSLKEALIDDKNVYICLETMAGKGSEIGSKFEELKQIIDNVASDKLMVCMDTCHMNDAGYEAVTIEWTSDNPCAVVDGSQLVITLPEEETVVTVTAKAVVGEKYGEKSFTVSVDA